MHLVTLQPLIQQFLYDHHIHSIQIGLPLHGFHPLLEHWLLHLTEHEIVGEMEEHLLRVHPNELGNDALDLYVRVVEDESVDVGVLLDALEDGGMVQDGVIVEVEEELVVVVLELVAEDYVQFREREGEEFGVEDVFVVEVGGEDGGV